MQIPDELFRRARGMAAAKEWSFAELVRRGLEQMTARHPGQGAGDGEVAWHLPDPVEQGWG
ncbi:MAG: antitoxin [Verrucomicrobia bacterium]|nr:antitoxin [Verrucomicrobiota bacterium]